MVSATATGRVFFCFGMKVFNLNMKIAQDALKSKEALEALAFCIMVKNTFTDSTIKNATIRKCKTIFHIGTSRMVRIIQNGIKYGYLIKRGDDIVANKFNDKKAFSYRLKFHYFKFDPELGCTIRIKDVVSIIRQAVVANHIRKMNSTTDTLNMTSSPKSTKEYKKAKARIKRMLKGDSFKIRDYVSNSRLAKIANTSLYNIRKCISSLVGGGIISWTYRSFKTNIDPNNFKEGLRRFFMENGCCGYLYRSASDGRIYCGGARVFKYNSDIIFFAK